MHMQQPESKIYVAIFGRFLYNYKYLIHENIRIEMHKGWITYEL